MESLPSKRRKTSPLTHISITPQDGQTRTTLQDGEQSSRFRASFMSPTKASLARFNPSLLPPFNASEPLRPRSQWVDSEGLTPQTPHSGTTEPNSTLGKLLAAPIRSVNGQGLGATPRRRSKTPGKEYIPNGNKQIPDSRTSPPLEAREEARIEINGHRAIEHKGEALLMTSTVVGAPDIRTSGAQPPSESPHLPSTPTHRGAPVQRSRMGFSDDGEPSLPSTPVHLGLEVPVGRPNGRLLSSPHRRPKTNTTSAARSSPLKPKDTETKLSVGVSTGVPSKLGPRVYINTMPQPPPNPHKTEQLRIKDTLVKLESQLQDIEARLIRQSLVSTWYQQDGKEMKEISTLRKDASKGSAKLLRFRGLMENHVIVECIDQDRQLNIREIW